MKDTISTRKKILTLLAVHADEGPISGASIARELCISRSAVWKAIHSLQNEGHDICSSQSRGYMLCGHEDILSEEAIASGIRMKEISVTVLDSTDSTNNFARSLPVEHFPQVVIADEQTGGRGRYGRSFYSPKGTGLYLSYAFTPLFPLNEMTYVTTVTAVVVRRVLAQISGHSLTIKWINDIYRDDRKIVGILTEGVGSLETVSFEKIIIGIGINCFAFDAPPEIRGIAGSLFDDFRSSVTRSEIACRITNALTDAFFGRSSVSAGAYLDEYRANCMTLGRRVTVSPFGAESYEADAAGINDRFELIVNPVSGPLAGTATVLSGGDVSVKPRTDA